MADKEIKLLTAPEVRQRLGGIGKTTFHARQNPKNPGYDPNFPKKVCLPGTKTYWSSIDVDNYIISLSHTQIEDAA